MLRLTQQVFSAGALRKARVRWMSSASSVARPADPTCIATDPDWSSARPYNELPGIKPLSLAAIWQHIFSGRQPDMDTKTLFKGLNKTYGPIMLIRGMLGKRDTVILFDPEHVAQVYRNEGTWPVRSSSPCLDYYFSKLRKDFPLSLAVAQGKEWQDFRSAVNQVMMQPRNTKQYVEPIDNVSKEFVDRMRAVRNEKLEMPLDFANEISKWALESITYVALDARLSLMTDLPPDSEGSKMIQAVHVVFDSMYELDFKPSPWMYVSTPAYRRFVASMDYFTKVSAKYVNLAMERLKGLPRDDERNLSVLENLLVQTKDPQRAVTMALDMLLAGIDTTGIVVSTVLYQLANHPEQQRKLQEELDRVMPDPSKTVTKQQLEEMRYLRACIKESMRVMPIFIGNARQTVKDMVIGGYQVLSGTLMSLAVSNEAHFPRADEFLPERWLPGGEDLKSAHPFAFLPFGFGPRMCVGRRFADLEIETVVARVFRSFSLEWNRPPAKTAFRIMLNFVDPLVFTVRDRL